MIFCTSHFYEYLEKLAYFAGPIFLTNISGAAQVVLDKINLI